MGWNHRILKFHSKYGEYYEICEVYYDKNGIPNAWGESHNLLYGDDLEELKFAYCDMQSAFEKPVLDVIDDKIVVKGKE